MQTDWDCIVIGAGSAGSVMAARLSEDPGRRVLLLEAGRPDRSPLIHIPGLVEHALASRALSWRCEGDPDPSLNDRRLVWIGGRVLGGSSSVNGMVYGRGLPADYERWSDAGNSGWSWQEMLPYFRRSERWLGEEGVARGTNGALHVRRFEETDAACAAAMDALVAFGVPRVQDYCAGISEGVGLTQATQRKGWRHSVASAYLRPAKDRRNLRILTGSKVLRVIVDGQRCSGVTVRRRGKTISLLAHRTIISAGAIGSPQLLLLSGIGPRDELARHGIRQVHALSGVGYNLNDHVNVRLSAFVGTPTYNTQRRGISAILNGAGFLLSGTGPASSPANHVQAFLKTDPSLRSADVQIQLMALGFGSKEQMRRDGITAVVSLCHPEARGRVSLRSADPGVPARITAVMLGAKSDRDRLVKGCRIAYDALLNGPCRKFGGTIYAPSLRTGGDEEWLRFIRETAALNWHPTSTCRMGMDEWSVVDSNFAVRGLSDLFIVDASVMPSITSGNTNAVVIAIAERAAETIARA